MPKFASKDEKPLQDKLKRFFMGRKPPVTSGLPRNTSEVVRISDDILDALDSKHPFAERVRAMREIVENLQGRRFEDGGVEVLWQKVADLVEVGSTADMNSKVAAMEFLTKLVVDQGQQLSGPMRAVAFRTIVRSYSPEHLPATLALFAALTDSGRKASCFETEVGPFLLKIFPAVLGTNKVAEFLQILETVIKFNAAYLDPPLLSSYIELLANLCSWTGMESDIKASLDVLDAIISYSNLPTEALMPFTQTLCRLANFPDFCDRAWKSMKNLLGTCLGHSAIYAMASMLLDFESCRDAYLLRGAIFFISMGLWGAQRVTALKHTPVSVLPAIRHALDSDHALISYEAALSIRRLVDKHGKSQTGPTWDLMFSILQKLLSFCERKPTPEIGAVIHETFTLMERVIAEQGLTDEAVKLYGLIELCPQARPEESIFRLLDFWAERINPLRSQWLENLQRIVVSYFKKETRVAVRLRTLDILRRAFDDHRAVYEEEMVDRIVLPYLDGIESDKSVVVRERAVALLVGVAAQLQSKKFMRVVDILERVVRQPFGAHNKSADAVTIIPEREVTDVRVAVEGLTKIFRVKLYRLPSDHCIRIYQILVSHLLSHYRKVVVIENSYVFRYMIFECFLSLRADSRYHLGIPDADGTLRFSPYLMVDHRRGESHSQQHGPSASPMNPGSASTSPPPASPGAGAAPVGSTAATVFPAAAPPYPPCKTTFLSLTQACGALIAGLQKERDWKVCRLLLTSLPEVLGNKALTLSRNGNDIHYLVDAACSLINMANDKTLTLENMPVPTPDVQAYVFPVLIALVPYHRHVDPERQRSLVVAIKRGLLTKSSTAACCIDALTMSALEMTDTMHKIIPSILSELSRMSATVPIALPVLLFLSTLIRLPGVYKSFIEDEYRTIFAIALQYTNPVKFEHSVISLAHHVIAMWFLKCRLPLRRQLVSFVTKGLDDNALKTTAARAAAKSAAISASAVHGGGGGEDGHNKQTPAAASRQVSTGGDDSASDSSGANRPRSSSLHERATPYKRDLKSGPGSSASSSSAEENLLSFHQELAMTCLDLMARYSYAHVSPLTKRSSVSEFLLQNGVVESWIIGNEIVTITTSACSHRPMGPSGLCDNCWTRCRGNANSNDTHPAASTVVPTPPPISIAANPFSDVDSPRRKRHQSDYATGSPSQTSSLFWSSAAKDDLHVWNSEDNVGAGTSLEGGGMGSRSSSSYEDGQVLCCCHCQGWAEIHIRRPCGSTSWVMKIQNSSIRNKGICTESLLGDVMSLLLPSMQDKARGEMELDSVFRPAGEIRKQGEEMLDETQAQVVVGEDRRDGEEQGLKRRAVTSATVVAVPSSIPGLGLKGSRKSDPVATRSTTDLEAAGLHGIEEEDKERFADSSSSHSDGKAVVVAERGKSEQNSAAFKPDSSSERRTSPVLNLLEVTSSKSQESSPPQGQSQSVSPDASPVSSGQQSAAMSPSTSRPYAMHHRNSLAASTLAAATSKMSLVGAAAAAAGGVGSSPASEVPFRERSRTMGNVGQVDRLRSRFTLSRTESLNSGASGGGLRDPGERAGISPKFVFLQLFYGGVLKPIGDGDRPEESRPLLLPKSREVERSIKNLDFIYPFETHKIGVVYVGPGQLDPGKDSEKQILSNCFGSLRFVEFIQGLGEIIPLADIDKRTTFLGGLDTGGTDGEFSITWRDDLMQVIFHVATLMPNSEADPNCNHKKKHIGNDFVLIVYNESGRPYDKAIVKGQVIYSWVEVQPLPHGCNKIVIHARSPLDATLCAEGRPPPIISDRNLALYVRQVALHADLLSCFFMEASGKSPYSSKWLERLRQIRRLRAKVWEDKHPGSRPAGKDTTASPNKGPADGAASSGSGSGSSSPRLRRAIVQRVASFSDFV